MGWGAGGRDGNLAREALVAPRSCSGELGKVPRFPIWPHI